MAFFALFMGTFLWESKLDEPGEKQVRGAAATRGRGTEAADGKEELPARNRSYFDMQNIYETFCVLYPSGDP